ncbi:MFS transporter [Actinokineospora inagensis]|uniref:MFS transporter n=1 Tax=Actinokineospora inagensis TaxID=103730 RepID=UPI000405777B|nr:MFS transporter [Actinokineospora inagensis]
MPAPTTADTRARVAVAGVFLTNGALYATVVPRLPEIKADLALSNAALGTALAAGPLGALIAGLFAPALINRLRSSRVAALGIVALSLAVIGIGIAPGWLPLALALLVVGALDSVIDVAQNTHGLRVQRRYGRSIVNSFHGVWSIGAVTGGLLGSLAAGLRIPLLAHLTGAAALFSLVAVVCYRFMLPGPDDSERTPPIHAPGRAIWLMIALGVLAACGAVVEDSGSSWSAIYLTGLHAGAATAGLGFVCLQTAMTIGRLIGDRVTDRLGQRTVVRWGGGIAALGMGAALAVPSVWLTLVGFTLAGLGTATLIPAAMHSADELPGLTAGVGLTVVSWMLRIGSLISPPAVGLVADATSLRIGLLSVVLAGAVVVVLGRTMATGSTSHHP